MKTVMVSFVSERLVEKEVKGSKTPITTMEVMIHSIRWKLTGEWKYSSERWMLIKPPKTNGITTEGSLGGFVQSSISLRSRAKWYH